MQLARSRLPIRSTRLLAPRARKPRLYSDLNSIYCPSTSESSVLPRKLLETLPPKHRPTIHKPREARGNRQGGTNRKLRQLYIQQHPPLSPFHSSKTSPSYG